MSEFRDMGTDTEFLHFRIRRRSQYRLGLLVLCSACKPTTGVPPAAPHAVARTFRSMGSELQVTAWTAAEATASAAFEAVFEEMQRLDDLMTMWREGSDID